MKESLRRLWPELVRDIIGLADEQLDSFFPEQSVTGHVAAGEVASYKSVAHFAF